MLIPPSIAPFIAAKTLFPLVALTKPRSKQHVNGLYPISFCKHNSLKSKSLPSASFTISNDIKVQTENASVARRIFKLVKDTQNLKNAQDGNKRSIKTLKQANDDLLSNIQNIEKIVSETVPDISQKLETQIKTIKKEKEEKDDTSKSEKKERKNSKRKRETKRKRKI